MGQDFKRDWEIIRIFFILAVLTIGFVWGMQSILLAPIATPRLQSYSPSSSTAVDSDPHKSEIVLSKLGIFSDSATGTSIESTLSELLHGPTKVSRER